jgi:hypothetical protein
MTEHESLDSGSLLNPPGFCEVAGCTSPSMDSRWVILGSGDSRQIEVCWKHSEGDLDLDAISAG